MKRKDLEPFIGPRGRVADIMNRTRPLTLEMIRRLADGLSLPAEVLIKPYPLRVRDFRLFGFTDALGLGDVPDE